ncbi:acetylornithine deacetylase [Paraburkholderia acidisoli]|uniref:Acetylornithine deacetylase n=1 Tax=Paraburkholderia acidisoli TaxID=2571748 RepID=A0A7Z2GN04_9BURK|nr:acetylornithine deacetylase [Paraburkholderia acidisoli]QGZ64693.1 acetylornithine deacetylase [Paraburkholderia acidisoli]
MNTFSSQAMLAKLVGFPTVSRDSNLALIEFVQAYLSELGVQSELFYNAERTKANLFATIGPAKDGGIVLSGHTDVVPVDGQNWTVAPFELTERDGRLYGRGTADMKGYLASVLAAVPLFVERARAGALAVPVHLALSYDEEIGCVGVRPLLAALQARGFQPRVCIIGEPTEMQPVLGHKGKMAVRCCVRGAACHSAYAPYGVNAIHYAARLIGKLEEIGETLAQPEHRDERFDPPFSTVQAGLIRGGRALNIVPAECDFDFEVRAVPGFDIGSVAQQLEAYASDTLLPKMRAVQADTDIRFEALNAYPGLATDPDSDGARLIATVSGAAAGAGGFGTVAFGTEGGLYDAAGIPAVVCGPGSMDQGHKPDEFVAVEQLARCDAMMVRIADELGQA